MTKEPNPIKTEAQPLPNRYRLEVTDPADTGARLFSLDDEVTGISTVFVEFNPSYDIPAALAWSGARTSRSDDPHAQIYQEVVKANRAAKMEMFYGYGHQSIANMSPLMLHINNLPMSEAYWIFNHTSLVGGQETSTRYIELSNPTVTPIEDMVDLSFMPDHERQVLVDMWRDISAQSHAGFTKWLPLLEQRLSEFVRREHPDIKAGAMAKRALDAARSWLPFGGRTSMSLQLDVREAISIISQLNERGDYYGQQLAEQLTVTLGLKSYKGAEDIQADIAGLLKYAGGNDTIRPNTANVQAILTQLPDYQRLVGISKQYLQSSPRAQESRVQLLPAQIYNRMGSEVIAGYISTILPNVPAMDLANYVNSLTSEHHSEILDAIFADHTHHNLLRNAADSRGHTFEIETSLAYLRDFNRHRAMGRLAVMLETRNFDAIVRSGFNRSHIISNTDVLADLEGEWNQDFGRLYEQIYDFYEAVKAQLGENADYSFMYHILPLGHQAKLVMSGPLAQWNYLTHLRIRPGGDYGYRDITFAMIQSIIAESGMANFGSNLVKPDYNKPDELLDRK